MVDVRSRKEIRALQIVENKPPKGRRQVAASVEG